MGLGIRLSFIKTAVSGGLTPKHPLGTPLWFAYDNANDHCIRDETKFLDSH
jgi:hypothetical protein